MPHPPSKSASLSLDKLNTDSKLLLGTHIVCNADKPTSRIQPTRLFVLQISSAFKDGMQPPKKEAWGPVSMLLGCYRQSGLLTLTWSLHLTVASSAASLIHLFARDSCKDRIQMRFISRRALQGDLRMVSARLHRHGAQGLVLAGQTPFWTILS